jgi:hypothetical protein
MGRLENEARAAMTVLLKQGHSQSAVARLNPHAPGTLAFATWLCARPGGWTGYYGRA